MLEVPAEEGAEADFAARSPWTWPSRHSGRPGPCCRLVAPIPLLAPGVPIVVIPEALPETWLVVVQET